MYRIEVYSDFEEIQRYNTIISCGGYDPYGNEIYILGREGDVLECEDADSIFVLIYVIANALPESEVVADSPPFDLFVTITQDEEGEMVRIYHEVHKVNQWGGASIEIRLR